MQTPEEKLAELGVIELEIDDEPVFDDAPPLGEMDRRQAPKFTDEALALRFAEHHVGDLRYVAPWSRWMHFDGVRWTPDSTRLAFNMARAICREAAAECNQSKTATALASAKTRAAVITLANDDRRLAATPDLWDADPDTFNTPME